MKGSLCFSLPSKKHKQRFVPSRRNGKDESSELRANRCSLKTVRDVIKPFRFQLSHDFSFSFSDRYILVAFNERISFLIRFSPITRNYTVSNIGHVRRHVPLLRSMFA